jgi:hypothetical protein
MNAIASERWKAIPSYAYEVSCRGRVRRVGRPPLTPRRHSNGYSRVQLCDALSGNRDFYIHRLVCFAFYGEPPTPDCHADHINGDRADNRLENLQWATPEDNRARRNTARGERSGQAVLTTAQVVEIRKHCASPGISSRLAARYGVAPRTIRDVLNKRSWAHVSN